jgi:glycosyltransferase involved in cell wall biosynthesis
LTAGRRILVATADVLGPRMAGPAIRAWHIADALAADHDVRLVTTGTCDLSDDRFAIEGVDEIGLTAAVEWCEIIVLQGWILAGRPHITTSDRIIVCDIYDPMHLEQLEQGRDDGAHNWDRAVRGATVALNEQLHRGDYFICASEKQRDFWLGQLAGLGRLNPVTYAQDGTLRRLIDVVPFGTADEPLHAERSAVRGVLPGIDEHSKVILWGGGVYNWFDPLTLVRAVHRLHQRRPEVRLVFMGMAHPNPDIPTMRIAAETQRLCDELGLTGSVVHFNEGWVPFAERQEFLRDADIGVSTHFDHVETEFSFRTRILDYFWAGLPIVATTGDDLAALIDREGAGLVVPPDDVAALEAALDRLLGDDELARSCAAASRALGVEHQWSRVLRPLVAFCRSASRAPDLLDEAHLQLWAGDVVVVTRSGGRLRHDLATLRAYWREGGAGNVLRNVAKRLRRLVGRDAAGGPGAGGGAR